MKFEKIFPKDNSNPPMVEITINTVDNDLEYKLTLLKSEAYDFVKRLTQEKWVNRVDTEDSDIIYYINTKNIISIDVENI
ncbi:MAG: hypothetical protein J6Y28_00635 [Acholeplasmatales bacterium]|nr:hypothetical protein [Acholeplasmatales bacterium]